MSVARSPEAQVNTVVRGVCAALEIIDSRYENFKFTLPDVVADNASSTRFVLGSDCVGLMKLILVT